MKKSDFIYRSLIAAACALTLTACSNDDDIDITNELILSEYEIPYAESGEWSKVYDTEQGNLTLGDITFSHSAGYVAEWDYSYWNGFCPSRSKDTEDHPDAWVKYQWSAITGGGVAGTGTPYMLGFWKSDETGNEHSCAITCTKGNFVPKQVYATNSCYGYYGMKNGSAFNKAFSDGDYCILHIYGYLAGSIMGEVEVYLAKDSNILDTWEKVDLSGLGTVDKLVFKMTSSDTGEWGMNNPAYFCLDRLSYSL